MPEALYYLESDNTLFLRALGHITAALCSDLRERVYPRLDGEVPVLGMYVDLAACDYMDSTFMGLLVGFNKRLLKSTGKRLVLVSPSAGARDLLAGLGLTALVDIRDGGPTFPKNLEPVEKTRPPGADMLLKAHENLMDISAENRKKFAGLHSVLKSQQDGKLIPD